MLHDEGGVYLGRRDGARRRTDLEYGTALHDYFEMQPLRGPLGLVRAGGAPRTLPVAPPLHELPDGLEHSGSESETVAPECELDQRVVEALGVGRAACGLAHERCHA